MKKEFVKIGHKFTNLRSYDPREALLYELSKAIRNDELKSDKLKLEFKTLQFNEYPNGKAVVDTEYRNHDGELYWCGTKYDTIDELIAELSEQKYFEVLTVEEE